jgi:peptidyl-prolyl cis-trans isomerase B (cyclophilin B)
VKVRFALLVSALALTGVVAGCGGGSSSTTSAAPDTSVSTSTAAGGTTTAAGELTACLDSGQPTVGDKPTFSKPEQVLKPGANASIVMKTSCGTITIKLDPKAGGPIPNSVAFLVGKGFYDGLTFHRVVPDFVLQGGDPKGNGSGGPGYQVVGAVPAGYQYVTGDVAMAKTQSDPPGSAGSQFFIVTSANGGANLTAQPDYGILGHATDPVSLATIARIAALGVSDGPPSKPVWIISAKVKPAA